MAQKKFRVKLITYHNVMGLRDGEIKPGALTLIDGKNGLGKTSHIESLKAALGKGHKATIVREGESSGEVVIVLDGGDDQNLNVSAKFTKDETKRQVAYEGQPPMTRTAEVIAGLRNEFTLFPTSFLTKDKDQRLQLFLSAIPLTVERESIQGLLNLCPNGKLIDCDRHAFKVLDEIEQSLYDKRKELNAVVANNRKTVTTMTQALPPEATDGAALDGQLQELRKSIGKIDAAFNDARWRIDQTVNTAVASAQKAFDDVVAKARQARDLAVAEAKQDAEDARAELVKKHEVDRADLVQREADTSAKASTFTRSAETRKLINQLMAEAEGKQIQSDALTLALDTTLQDARTALLVQCPIKGVIVKDRDLYVMNDAGQPIPFEAVNTRERIRIATDLCLLHAGPLPLVLMDGAEALDQESLDELRDRMEERGAQCIATRVTDDEKITIHQH